MILNTTPTYDQNSRINNFKPQPSAPPIPEAIPINNVQQPIISTFTRNKFYKINDLKHQNDISNSSNCDTCSNQISTLAQPITTFDGPRTFTTYNTNTHTGGILEKEPKSQIKNQLKTNKPSSSSQFNAQKNVQNVDFQKIIEKRIRITQKHQENEKISQKTHKQCCIIS